MISRYLRIYHHPVTAFFRRMITYMFLSGVKKMFCYLVQTIQNYWKCHKNAKLYLTVGTSVSNYLHESLLFATLGFILTPDFLFPITSEIVASSASSVRMLGLLSRLSYYLTDLLCIIHLLSCPVRTKLEFGSVIWNSLSATDATRIESIQKRFIRII